MKSISGIQLGLFDERIVYDAKERGVRDWPPRERFPLNFARETVEAVLVEDIRASENVLLVTGFTSLDYLIDYITGLDDERPAQISLLLGSEPSPARRREYSLKDKRFTQEVLDYWLEKGISIGLCYKVVLFMEMLKSGRISSRYIPDSRKKLHAKIYITDPAASLGSSNFSFTGFRSQLEANVRFDAAKEPKRYRETARIAHNYWGLGEDYNQDLLSLLERLLKVVNWQEALGRACGELLEGEWAERYIRESKVGSGKDLWPSQKVGIAQALWMVENVGSVLVADATGSGKTRMGVHLLRAIMDRIWSTGRVRKDLTVLVCPPNVVLDSWQREAGACGLPLTSMSHGILSYKSSDKHHDTLQLVRRAQSLAVDEAHNFLNPASSRTRGLLGNMADVMVMFTATPINRGIRDLLRLVDLLGADNLEESALRLFERLEQRSRKSGSQFVTTHKERLAMQKEVQRFTLRRTKSILNAMVSQDEESYRDDRGRLCRYPDHHPQTYDTMETPEDQKLAEEIRKLAGRLNGLVNLRSGIEIPEGLRERIDNDRYIQGRLLGARGLAVYHVMSRLRSSRAALIEHLLGTKVAADRFGITGTIKTEPTGNILHTLADMAGKVKESSLREQLPVWLVSPEEHRRRVDEELALYRQILDRVERMSDAREQAKADLIASLGGQHDLILAFDSCLITLEVIRLLLKQREWSGEALVATGSKKKVRKRVNELFALGSTAKGVVALCSDAMSEGLNLQQASSVVLLDMPSVIRIAEQRVGRVDRMNSPHDRIEVWWPLDSTAFSLKTDKKFFSRYTEVKDILGSNLELPEDLVPPVLADSPGTVDEMVEKLEELNRSESSWDGIHDAFQPVRDLVDPERGLVPAQVYDQVRQSTARVLSSVSLVKAKRPWAFFAISGIDRGAPKWILLESPTAKPVTHLEEVAGLLRSFLGGGVENRAMDKEASLLVETFLSRILATEKELLPRKKQRALEEMRLVLLYYLKKLEKDGGERRELLQKLLGLIEASGSDEERPDLDSVAEAWLDLTRELWYEKLLKRRGLKPLRLKDIRKELQQKPLSSEELREAFSSVPRAQPLYSRVVSAIVGVPGG